MADRVSASPGFVALLCGMIYLDNYGLVPPFLLGCILHEAGHLLVLRCFGLRPVHIQLGLRGAVIETGFPDARSEALTALAGPLVNLLLVCLFRGRWPQGFLVNALLLGYNLLPLYPLDGGRLLRLLLRALFAEETAERLQKGIALACVAVLVCLCLYFSFYCHAGLFPLLFAAVFLFRISKTLVKSDVN